VKPQPPASAEEVFAWHEPGIPPEAKAEEGCYCHDADGLKFLRRCPYGAPGDRLWVREAHQFLEMADGNTICAYRASCEGDSLTCASPLRSTVEAIKVPRWRPGIHMPRDASRLLLEVTDVRVERLQAITEEEARAEGVEARSVACAASCEWRAPPPSYRHGFGLAWDSIYSDEFAWSANPWVWVISFRRVEVRP
jgi:hypothetical protein